MAKYIYIDYEKGDWKVTSFNDLNGTPFEGQKMCDIDTKPGHYSPQITCNCEDCKEPNQKFVLKCKIGKDKVVHDIRIIGGNFLGTDLILNTPDFSPIEADAYYFCMCLPVKKLPEGESFIYTDKKDKITITNLSGGKCQVSMVAITYNKTQHLTYIYCSDCGCDAITPKNDVTNPHGFIPIYQPCHLWKRKINPASNDPIIFLKDKRKAYPYKLVKEDMGCQFGCFCISTIDWWKETQEKIKYIDGNDYFFPEGIPEDVKKDSTKKKKKTKSTKKKN